MKRWLGSLVVALAVVAVGGGTPGCSCAHSSGTGDGGGGNAGSGGGAGGDSGFNACGDNDPACTTACLGPTCQPPSSFPLPGDTPPDPNVGADGVGRDPNGWIVLNQGKSSFNYLWIADDQAYWLGMVSKIDTRKSTAAGGGVNHDYREVARYLTVTCESNEAASWRSHAGYSIGGATPTQLGTCDGTNGCCARTATGTARTPVQLYHNRPSRTAVDFNGDAWVANRAHDSYGAGSGDPGDAGIHHQSSATKIANKNNSINDTDCIDRNHNGKIETSFDANGDGIINTDCNGNGIPDSLGDVATTPCAANTPQEFFGLDDECILFTTNTGAEGGVGRPLALGQGATDFAPSDAWAGRFTDGVFYRIDGTTGLIKQTLPLTVGGVAARPYGAAIDQTGILWAPNVENTTLYYADTNTPANIGKISPPNAIAGASGFYGIAIDGFKTPLTAGGLPQLMQDVWMATISSPHLVRYTPNRTGGFGGLGGGQWTDFTWTGASGNGRGVGIDNRVPSSFAWLALDGSNALGQVKVDDHFVLPTGTVGMQPAVTLPAGQVYSTNGGITTLGAGVAADLDLWGVNQGNAGTTLGNATHFHVDTNGVVTPPTAADQVRLDDNGLTAGGAAHRAPYPYTYSDFTGFGLRNFTNPHGSYSYIWTGCGVGKTKWISVTWDAATPPGTTISMKARSSDDKSTFSTATFTGNYTTSPADLLNAAPSGGSSLTPNPSGFLQVEFDLTTTDKNSTPALKSYTVVYECLNGIG